MPKGIHINLYICLLEIEENQEIGGIWSKKMKYINILY